METENPNEKTKFWRDPALGNMEMLQATYITHAFSKHTHDSFVVGVVERGAEQFEYRHSQHIAWAGQIVLINPGEPHTGQAATKAGWTYRTMYPDPDLLQQAVSQIAGRERSIPFFAQAVITDEQMARRVSELHRSLENQTSPLERQSRLLWTFGQLIIRYANDQLNLRLAHSEPVAVARVREYLESQYAENILLEQLAAIVNLSPFHLLRVFRQEIGLPPHAYLTQVRIRRAKAMLITGLPISQVALQTGFSDQSHLNRHFKRSVGVTPSKYSIQNS